MYLYVSVSVFIYIEIMSVCQAACPYILYVILNILLFRFDTTSIEVVSSIVSLVVALFQYILSE